MACLTSAIEPLRAANEICGYEAFRWQILSDIDGSVKSSAGVVFTPDATLAEAGDFDYIFLTSSPNGTFDNNTKAKVILQHYLRFEKTTGAFSYEFPEIESIRR